MGCSISYGGHTCNGELFSSQFQIPQFTPGRTRDYLRNHDSFFNKLNGFFILWNRRPQAFLWFAKSSKMRFQTILYHVGAFLWLAEEEYRDALWNPIDRPAVRLKLARTPHCWCECEVFVEGCRHTFFVKKEHDFLVNFMFYRNPTNIFTCKCKINCFFPNLLRFSSA